MSFDVCWKNGRSDGIPFDYLGYPCGPIPRCRPIYHSAEKPSLPMTDHSEKRKVLWLERAFELGRAQSIDQEVEGLLMRIEKGKAEAVECRRRANELEQAAEILAAIDGPNSPPARSARSPSPRDAHD